MKHFLSGFIFLLTVTVSIAQPSKKIINENIQIQYRFDIPDPGGDGAANYPIIGYSAEWNVHSDRAISYNSMIASADGNIYATVWCYPAGDYHWQGFHW